MFYDLFVYVLQLDEHVISVSEGGYAKIDTFRVKACNVVVDGLCKECWSRCHCTSRSTVVRVVADIKVQSWIVICIRFHSRFNLQQGHKQHQLPLNDRTSSATIADSIAKVAAMRGHVRNWSRRGCPFR